MVQILPGSSPPGAAALCQVRALHGAGLRRERRTEKKKRSKDALNSLSEISVGDLVVHQHHGIGRYAGISEWRFRGVTKDYLRIEYDKKDVLCAVTSWICCPATPRRATATM